RRSSDYSDDRVLVAALRRGDDAAFGWLLDRYTAPLRRLARNYVSSGAAVDEVIQDTWLGVITGIERFERLSSVKTLLYRILLTVARTKGVREHRTIPFSSASDAFHEGAAPAVDPERFLPEAGWGRGHWAAPPVAWDEKPEERLLSREASRLVRTAIEGLPA